MCHGLSDSDILQLFVKIFHKLLDSKIRFEKTRDVPLILTTAFSTNTKFRASCEHFLTHCKLYGSWKDKTGSAKARCDSFKKCLETMMGNGLNIILPPPIIIERMDIQENNRKCSGGYRYLIREIIEKLEDKEGCRKDAGERISECGNNQIIEIIQEYHHYNLRFWTVTPEKPQRHRHQRYNRSSLMSYTPKLRHSGHNDDDGDYQISTTNAQSTNNYMPISIDNNNDNYSFNDAYNDYNNNVPPKVNLSLDNIYDNTRSQYVDNRTHTTKPGIIPLRIMSSIGGNSSISDMSQSSTPTTTSHRSTNTAASIPKGINVNGVNSNRSMKYSPIRSQSPYHSPRHNPLHGQGAGNKHRGFGFSKVIKSQRLQPQIPQIPQIMNIHTQQHQHQHQRPSFSRMSSADSSIPDMDRLPGLPIDAGNLCTIKSGQEMDDEEDVDIPVISAQNLRYQQIPMVCLDNNGDHRPFQSGSIINNHPNITRDLPAPPRVVMNNNNINALELQSRNGIRHLSQELPMPKQQCMSHQQRGMMGIMNQNYNPPSFDMDFNHNQYTHSHNNNNNGNIIFNQNNTINLNFNNPHQKFQNHAQDMLTSGTLHRSYNNNDHNNTQELHQQSHSQSQSQSNSQQFTFPTAKSTSNWYAKWNSKSNNNTSNDFNNNNNFNGNNQNGSDSNTEQRQFDITNINNFDHTQLNSSNYDNCVIPSNVQQFTQFDHNNQYTNNEAMHHRTAPNIIYGNNVNDNNGSSGYNNDNYHNLNNNNNSNMINDSNTFLFSGRNSQRMQLHNFGSYN